MPDKPARKSYHHGDLHETLVIAAWRLVSEYGPERFSMADACREAGVSKAAPYRHFANKEALLLAVSDLGFERLRDFMLARCEHLIPGTSARIAAIGMGYIDFAKEYPAIFKLMFGNSIELDDERDDHDHGACFQALLSEITARTQLTEVDQLIPIAFPLWTIVHGASMLIIDNAYEKIYPGSNIEAMIDQATAQLLADFPEPSTELAQETSKKA